MQSRTTLVEVEANTVVKVPAVIISAPEVQQVHGASLMRVSPLTSR